MQGEIMQVFVPVSDIETELNAKTLRELNAGKQMELYIHDGDKRI